MLDEAAFRPVLGLNVLHHRLHGCAFLLHVHVLVKGLLDLGHRDISLDVDTTMALLLRGSHRQVHCLVDHISVFIEDGSFEPALVLTPHLVDARDTTLRIELLRVVAERLSLLAEGLGRVRELFLAVRLLGLLGVGDEDSDGRGGLEVDQNGPVHVEILVPLEGIVAFIALLWQVED